MKKEKNPGGNNPKANSGENPSNPVEQSAPENNAGEKKETNPWKNPDPTTPERKSNPDPTKPEKEEGPYADDSKQKKPSNPAKVENKSGDDEDIGSLEEQDIDDQGITGEEKDETSIDESDADEEARKAS